MSLAKPIPEPHYLRRRQLLAERPDAAEADGFLWWGSHRIMYLSGFPFIPTERPIGLVIARSGETVLFVPRLEVEHAEAYAYVDRIVSYDEYPGLRHPMEVLADLLRELGVTGKIYGDGPGAPGVMGYEGPNVTDLVGGSFVPFAGVLERVMQVKEPEEIELIRESARWGARAHRLLQDYTKVGLVETEVEQRAAVEATRELLAEYQGTYRAMGGMGAGGPRAGYRGQIGAHSAFPHAINISARFALGDTLVTGASCPMFGYTSELERTMFLGEPNPEQRRFFDHMLALQDLAIDACRPGILCSEVDRRVRSYFDVHELWPYWRHHVGHNIGLRYHEGPFLDIGDDTVIEAGMLFTVEPGLYVEGLGGFRHSDTILVTEGEPAFLTVYPRDLGSLILEP